VYVVASVAFGILVGILVLVLLRGLLSATSSSTPRPVLDLVLGGAAIGYAAAAWAGWAPRRRSTRPPDEPTWIHRRLARMTVGGAVSAGVLTHLPGLVYLAALNAIVASTTDSLLRLLQVVGYNLIWCLLPLTALVLSLRRPELCRELLDRLGASTHRHRRLITVVFLGGFGGYLVWSGLTGLG
jgi:uncharacterized membrane protein